MEKNGEERKVFESVRKEISTDPAVRVFPWDISMSKKFALVAPIKNIETRDAIIADF